MKLRNKINKSVVLEMRRSGMPMRKIAEGIGRSRERVRQILVKSLGTTNHEYLSTLQLCNQSGLPRNRIVEQYLDGIITPIAKWDAGNRDYLLWSPNAVHKISVYYKNYRLCKFCNKPLPKDRIFFCSDDCRHESQKYKYMTPKERKRMLENIRRYRERRKYGVERRLADVVLNLTH
jgi:predicted nucleic acid-binding Zn ribbon protein